jgi:phycoerythrin-associated linker protein
MALWIAEADPIELFANATEEDLQTVIRAVYRQVLGNQHVMESQRLTSAESQLRNGDITVRGFVGAVAQSDLYQSLFFESSSAYGFVELNFKHLLGRAPTDQSEVSEHVVRCQAQGYTAEINSYVDSEEYLLNFGENTVPFARGQHTQIGSKNVDFNRMFAVMRGFAASSDRKTAKLIGDIGGNLPTKIKSPASGSGAYNNTGKRFRVTAQKGKAGVRGAAQGVTTVTVDYSSLSQRIQGIQKSGGKILSIVEAD